jgi:hypothetical protein
MTVFCCLFLVTGLFAANTDVPLPEGNGVKGVFQAGKRQISGTVVDETGEPVIGANVVEKGTANGIITDVDGHFSLSVSGGAVLQVSYIGYITQEVTVGNQSTLQIALREDLQALEEVVVVGYGTQKKINLTGSVVSVGEAELTKRPAPSVQNLLQGKVAGLQINQSGGTPGGDAGTMRIRGVGTFSGAGSNPLVLVETCKNKKGKPPYLSESAIKIT